MGKVHTKSKDQFRTLIWTWHQECNTHLRSWAWYHQNRLPKRVEEQHQRHQRTWWESDLPPQPHALEGARWAHSQQQAIWCWTTDLSYPTRNQPQSCILATVRLWVDFRSVSQRNPSTQTQNVLCRLIQFRKPRASRHWWSSRRSSPWVHQLCSSRRDDILRR